MLCLFLGSREATSVVCRPDSGTIAHSLHRSIITPHPGTCFQSNNFQAFFCNLGFENENNKITLGGSRLTLEKNIRYTNRNHRDRKMKVRVLFRVCYNKQEVLLKALMLLILICGDVHTNPGPVADTATMPGEIHVAAWNVRTLLNDACVHYRRTAVIGRELARCNIDIAALSETRISGVDQELVERGAGYTFFTIGKPESEPRYHGVGFAIKNTLLAQLGEQRPHGINCRLSHMKIKLASNRFINIVSAYAPTLDASDEDKDAFYEDLSTLLGGIPGNQKIILLGDFNARVGRDYNAWEKIIGKHGTGTLHANANGIRLLSLCAEHGLAITNTMYQQADRYKTTWMHQRTKKWHLIDYVIVRQKDISDVRFTKSVTASTIWSDHRMVRSKIKVTVAPPVRANRVVSRKRLCIQSLSAVSTKTKLSDCITDALQRNPPKQNPTEEWENIRDIANRSAVECLGYTRTKHKDWFDEQDNKIKPLLNTLHQKHDAWTEDRSDLQKQNNYHLYKQKAKRSIRNMKEKWWSERAKEIQVAADKHDTKAFYQGLKEVHGPKKRSTAAIKNKQGNELITDKQKILDRWAEHFNGVLNQISDFDETVLEEIPELPVNEELDTVPTIAETETAIKEMASGKAGGSDNIPAEVYKHGGKLLRERLQNLFKLIWEQKDIPQQLKDALIVHIYKNKGDITCCDNHRGISLLSIAGKVLARILLNRLQKHINDANLIPESQCGFRRYRGTTDMIFSVRQLQEKCREQNLELYMVFIDLTKAFDTVNREGLWKILRQIGCPETFVTIIRLLHDNMRAKIMDGGETSPDFAVTNGTKQGCVLAPTLFSIFFSMMLHVAFKNEQAGIMVRSRTDRGLLSSISFAKLLKSAKKCTFTLIRDLLFADDCALVALTQAELQQLTNSFSDAARRFGLTISLKKTEVMRQCKPNTVNRTQPNVNIQATKLNVVSKFTYLGSTIAANAQLDDEINHRIARAYASFGKFIKRLWTNHDIRLDTKISVYHAVVLSPLLYGSGAWTVYVRHRKALDRFHQKCLRRILGVRWQQMIPDTQILKRCKIPGMEALLMKSRLRWAGHLSRMSGDRIPKLLMYGGIDSAGYVKRGRPYKRYKDTLKDSLKNCEIPFEDWELVAGQKNVWRTTCSAGIKKFENNRIRRAEERREARLGLLPNR